MDMPLREAMPSMRIKSAKEMLQAVLPQMQVELEIRE